MSKVSILLVLSSACFGQQLWNGTRFGMSKDELEKLFGSRLELDRRLGLSRDYMLNTPEHFCGGDFEVGFIFFDKPRNRLAWVYFESLSGNPDGIIGKCVLRELTKELGSPKIVGTPTPEDGEYWFHRLFSKRWTVLYIQPKRVVIHYGSKRPSRYTFG